MAESIAELALIRELVTEILGKLQLDAYLFEIEPRKNQWELTVECAVKEGWETVRLPVTKTLLLQAAENPTAYQSLLNECRKALSACLIKT
jgi:hypothetical protein